MPHETAAVQISRLPKPTHQNFVRWGVDVGGPVVSVLACVEAHAEAGMPVTSLLQVAETSLAAYCDALDKSSQENHDKGTCVPSQHGNQEHNDHTNCSSVHHQQFKELHPDPRVVWQNSSLSLLWKPPGWSVSVKDTAKGEEDPVSGFQDDTSGVISVANELQDWVSAQWSHAHPIANDRGACHGLLHRLDRDTSGLLLCARTYRRYVLMQLQFATGLVGKRYVCLCHGLLKPDQRRIELPLLRQGPRHAMCSIVAPDGKKASTEILKVGHLMHESGCNFSLVEVRIHTGRLHQIRVHLASEGCPLAGDPLYGSELISSSGRDIWCPRIFLHAFALLVHDAGEGQHLDAYCQLPADLQQVLKGFQGLDPMSTGLLMKWW